MARTKRRIFNYRPMCLCALSLIAGIIVAEALYGENIALIAIPLGVGVAALVTLLVIKRTRAFFYIPLAMLIGFGAMTASGAAYDANMKYTDHSVNLNMTGVVSGLIYSDAEGTYFMMHDVFIGEEELKFDVRVMMSTEITPTFNAGDVVHVYGSLLGCAHKKFDTTYADAIADGEGYVVFAYYVNKRGEGKLSFPWNFQHMIRSFYYGKLDDKTASVCTALVLGDKFGMEHDLKTHISASGLSHILAVSGLHITTLATLLYFILKKLKVKPFVSLIIVTALTFVYAMLCSFTASALRAFVMSGVFNFASSFGKKRDNLSALSFGAILILTFRPTALFELGFLLSFASMLGIFLFFKSFNDNAQRAIKFISPKHCFGKRAAELVCVTLSASAMSYPFVAYFIGTIPVLQLLSNIVFVPYMMSVYVALLALTAFSLITTLHPTIIAMRFLLFPFLKYVDWVGSLSFSLINLPAITVPAIVCYLLIAVFMSRFNLMPWERKLKGGLIATSLSVVLCAAIAAI